MSIRFRGFVFVWLLHLTASSPLTSASTSVATVEVGGNTGQTPEWSSTTTVSEDSARVITPSGTAWGNTATQAPTSQATPTSPESTWAQINSTTSRKLTTGFTVTTEASEVKTSQPSPPTTTTSLTAGSSTPSQNTGQTYTFQQTETPPHPSTHPAQTTQHVSTTNTSTPPAGTKPTSTSPATATSTTTTPLLHSTKTTEDSVQPDRSQGSTHGKTVAGIIGGALLVMMLGFLVILVKKRKLQKQQITSSDWAGPSPFLESSAENGQITRQSSNRISLSSFLPQRLSKRLSLLPETEEELEDMTPGTTFGDKHEESTFGQKVDRTVAPETNTADSPQNDLLSTNSNAAGFNQDSANSPAASEAVGDALVQPNDDPK